MHCHIVPCFRSARCRCAVSILLAALAADAFAVNNLNLAAHRSRLRLAAPPGDAAQVLDVQKRLLAAKTQPDAPKTRDVVVTGQIGGMPNVWPETHPDFPWYRGQASFFLVDSKVAAQFAAHARRHGGGHECAFCKGLAAKNVHAIAVVNFVDEEGQILRVDTRELLDLKENQTVTLRGKAKLLAGSMLVIDADGIYSPQR
jgi:hypothetical protein